MNNKFISLKDLRLLLVSLGMYSEDGCSYSPNYLFNAMTVKGIHRYKEDCSYEELSVQLERLMSMFTINQLRAGRFCTEKFATPLTYRPVAEIEEHDNIYYYKINEHLKLLVRTTFHYIPNKEE